MWLLELLEKYGTPVHSSSESMTLPTLVLTGPKPVIPSFKHMKEKEDVEDFFAAFESHMGNHNVVQEEWAKHLVPAMRSEANSTYSRMNSDDRTDYGK